jgi:hypothetical protein
MQTTLNLYTLIFPILFVSKPNISCSSLLSLLPIDLEFKVIFYFKVILLLCTNARATSPIAHIVNKDFAMYLHHLHHINGKDNYD